MKLFKPILLILLLFVVCLHSFSQRVKVAFTISSAEDVRVPNATIILNEEKYKADSSGKAIIEVSPGYYNVNITSVNYFASSTRLSISKDTNITVVLRLRES